MEVVLLLVAIAGIALIAVPRMQRRSRGGRRPARVKAWTPAAKRSRTRGRASAASAAPAVATWTPGDAPASDEDAWDDDLGWEGVETAAPETREAWEQWRATESPLASGPTPEPEVTPEPELPSVERWRAKAQEDSDWVEDDDGLGWEGERDDAPVLWNGNGNGHEPAPEPGGLASNSNGNGHHAPAPEPGTWMGTGQVSGRDWTGGGDRAAREPEPMAPALASASAATDVAQPEAGRTIEIEDEDSEPAAGRSWRAGESTPAPAPAATPRGKRATRLHPVLMLAIYAVAGIGLVVLASTMLLGGSADPAPADPVPTSAATPQATAPAPTSATPAATSDPAAGEAATAEAAAAAARKARRAFRSERSRAVRSRGAAVDAARAKARAAAKARKRTSSNRSAGENSTPPPTTDNSPPVYTPPAQQSNPAPAPRRSEPVCEFCIG